MQQTLETKLRAAGFVGVETQGDVTFARSNAALPEFSIETAANGYLFAVSWQYRATPTQRADWAAQFERAPMDVDLGETRVQKIYGQLDAAALSDWAEIVQAMVARCVQWRRQTRQGDEGC